MSQSDFNRTLKRVENLLRLHGAVHGRQGRPAQHVSDLLRGALVLTTAALDAHILDCIGKALPGSIQRGKAGSALASWVRSNPERALECIAADNPSSALATCYFDDKLARSTFQKSARIDGTLFEALGCESPFPKAALKLGTDATLLRDELSAIAQRRDQIVHAGDVSNGKTSTIRIEYVRRVLDVVRAVGEATAQTVAAHSRRTK